jgi:hypothetical protein
MIVVPNFCCYLPVPKITGNGITDPRRKKYWATFWATFWAIFSPTHLVTLAAQVAGRTMKQKVIAAFNNDEGVRIVISVWVNIFSLFTLVARRGGKST